MGMAASSTSKSGRCRSATGPSSGRSHSQAEVAPRNLLEEPREVFAPVALVRVDHPGITEYLTQDAPHQAGEVWVVLDRRVAGLVIELPGRPGGLGLLGDDPPDQRRGRIPGLAAASPEACRRAAPDLG